MKRRAFLRSVAVAMGLIVVPVSEKAIRYKGYVIPYSSIVYQWSSSQFVLMSDGMTGKVSNGGITVKGNVDGKGVYAFVKSQAPPIENGFCRESSKISLSERLYENGYREYRYDILDVEVPSNLKREG